MATINDPNYERSIGETTGEKAPIQAAQPWSVIKEALLREMAANEAAQREVAQANQRNLTAMAETRRKIIEGEITKLTTDIFATLIQNPLDDLAELRPELEKNITALPDFVKAQPADLRKGLAWFVDVAIQQMRDYCTERKKLANLTGPENAFERQTVSVRLAQMSNQAKFFVCKAIVDFEATQRGRPDAPTVRRDSIEFARPTAPLPPVARPATPPSGLPVIRDFSEADAGRAVDAIFTATTTGAFMLPEGQGSDVGTLAADVSALLEVIDGDDAEELPSGLVEFVPDEPLVAGPTTTNAAPLPNPADPKTFPALPGKGPVKR